MSAVDVLAEAASWLPYDGDDNNIRQRFDEVRAALAELIEVGKDVRDRVGHNLANGSVFISEDVQAQFDRLCAALARCGETA